MLTPYPWQASQWQRLLTVISHGKLPHALLLTGMEGIGLGHFADCLSARLLCLQPQATGIACGSCKSCILFKAGNHPDRIRIEPEEKGKQIKVESIRDLIEYTHLSSQYGRHKIAVIDPAEAMNRSSANGLLKTLEEPPASTLILVSHLPSLLPVTVRSRCQRLNFHCMEDAATVEWLRSRLDGEESDIRELLAMTRGAPLKALRLLKMDALPQIRAVLQDLQAMRADEADPVNLAKKWQDFGPTEVLQWLLLFFNRMVRLKLGDTGKNTPDSRTTYRLQELANGLDLAQLVTCHDRVLENYHAVTGPFNLNKLGLLEDIIIYWQSIGYQQRG
ncbi:MAG: DNA polymerase III subunit delta' [Gammaproteobacteria bacterium]